MNEAVGHAYTICCGSLLSSLDAPRSEQRRAALRKVEMELDEGDELVRYGTMAQAS